MLSAEEEPMASEVGGEQSPEKVAELCNHYDVRTCECDWCHVDLGPLHEWKTTVLDFFSGEPIPVCEKHKHIVQELQDGYAEAYNEQIKESKYGR
jgi:hypothetical protein